MSGRKTILTLLLLVTARAAADPRPMSTGAEPAPAGSTKVALVREDLTIDVSRTHADVRAVLSLENGGPATRMSVGFPCDASRDPGAAGLVCKTPLTVRVDGKRVAARLKKNHWIWPMKLAAAQKVTLEVSYRAPLINDRYEVPSSGMGLLHYRLATGAEWAGPIGELNMEVRMPNDALLYIWPAGYERSTGTVTWHLKDYEPTSDVGILVHPMYRSGLGANTRDEMLKKLAAGDFSADKVAGVVREMRFHMDDILDYGAFYAAAEGSKLTLSKPTREDMKACLLASLKMMEETAGKGQRANP